jgi:hypothetical protein
VQVSAGSGHRFDDVCAGISRLGASDDDLWPYGTALRAASRLPRLSANHCKRCAYHGIVVAVTGSGAYNPRTPYFGLDAP